MLRYSAYALLMGAGAVEGFAPSFGAGLPALKSAKCSTRLALRMQENDVEYKPIIPTPENPMAPDYKNEPTQFERQGLVSQATSSSEKNVGSPGALEEFGGLTRREAYGAGGAVGVGLVAVAWAFTRNPGYDRKDAARDAGKVELNKDALKSKEVTTNLASIQASRDKLQSLYDAFKADNNAQLSAQVKGSFDIVKIRDEFNKLTFAVFDEDTQIKTDRIVRNSIQSLVELEQATKLKEGVARSPKRVAACDKWFRQSIAEFDAFLVYFK
mmetsp:Transcript_59079/g.121070  ORF Transcript_59079/g.121070 Transcript_59079/m.121070 type:complete len:270 (+) Transcript_59079:41-850(+)